MYIDFVSLFHILFISSIRISFNPTISLLDQGPPWEEKKIFQKEQSVMVKNSVRTNIYFGPNRISNIICLSQIVRIE